jgi:hypothetical protein
MDVGIWIRIHLNPMTRTSTLTPFWERNSHNASDAMMMMMHSNNVKLFITRA